MRDIELTSLVHHYIQLHYGTITLTRRDSRKMWQGCGVERHSRGRQLIARHATVYYMHEVKIRTNSFVLRMRAQEVNLHQ